MRRDKANELPWRCDLGFLPEFRKMLRNSGAATHFAVFLQDRSRHVKVRRFGNGDQGNSALEGCGNQYVCVDYQTKGKHPLFGFRDREALMIWSISRELILLVPLRSDSSPITRNSSGSGTASFT